MISDFLSNLMAKAKEGVQAPDFKKYLYTFLAAVALFCGGYAFGQFAQPAKVITKEKVVTKEVEKVVYQDRVVEKKVYVYVEKKKEHTETVTEKRPDGTVITKEVTDTHTDSNTSENTDKTEEKVVYKDRVVYQEKIVEKIREARKLDWRVGAGVGVSIPYYLQGTEIGVPMLRGAVIQVEVDRRIIGPVFVGLFGNSQGTVGLNISGIF